MRTALMTVTTSNFIPGTRRMLQSFLKHHPNFDSEIIVVGESFSQEERTELLAISPLVRLRQIGQDLAIQIAEVANELPTLLPTQARFYSIEALRPKEFDQILFVDSDVLFLGSIGEIFTAEADCSAAPDGCHLRRQARHPETFKEIDLSDGAISDTFNAGLMLFGKNALTGSDFDEVLARLSPSWFHGLRCGLHDQSLFNRQFTGRTHLLDNRFNFLLRHRGLLFPRVIPREIRALHFNLSPKPWEAIVGQRRYEADPVLRWAWNLWHER